MSKLSIVTANLSAVVSESTGAASILATLSFSDPLFPVALARLDRLNRQADRLRLAQKRLARYRRVA